MSITDSTPESTGILSLEWLQQRLFQAGHETIEDFLGYEYPWGESEDVTARRIEMAYQQMPDEELRLFYKTNAKDREPMVERTYGVFVSRNGYCQVKATSAAEAQRIVDEEFKTDDVSWDEDWHPTDVQEE